MQTMACMYNNDYSIAKRSPLRHGHLVLGCVAPSDVVIQLPLDVPQQAAGSDAEQVRLRPLVPKLLLHQGQPGEGVFGAADPSSRLETNLVPAWWRHSRFCFIDLRVIQKRLASFPPQITAVKKSAVAVRYK